MLPIYIFLSERSAFEHDIYDLSIPKKLPSRFIHAMGPVNVSVLP